MPFTSNVSEREAVLPIEERTARLTVLIDPRKKAVFERLCAQEDSTPSQVVRRLVRRYIEERTGKSWAPPERSRAGKPSGRSRRAQRRV
jgi:ribbon-helix-helix protein